jgi:hypothetical protein
LKQLKNDYISNSKHTIITNQKNLNAQELQKLIDDLSEEYRINKQIIKINK